ncbi:MAG: hypothetical protein ACTS46_00785 [Candidatus Hodgkinia cicadicola]
MEDAPQLATIDGFEGAGGICWTSAGRRREVYELVEPVGEDFVTSRSEGGWSLMRGKWDSAESGQNEN